MRQNSLAEAVARERDGLVRAHAAETEALRERHRTEMKRLQVGSLV
jgi:cytosine/adenosine deaminase-related metal-dependent hydrolase